MVTYCVTKMITTCSPLFLRFSIIRKMSTKSVSPQKCQCVNSYHTFPDFYSFQPRLLFFLGGGGTTQKCWIWPGHQASISPMASFSYSKYLLFGLPVLVLVGLSALWWERNERKRCYKEVGRVSGLFIYPVKSCKGIRVDEVKCLKEGMQYDR